MKAGLSLVAGESVVPGVGRRPGARRWLPPALVLIAAVGLWQLVTVVFGTSPTILPGPALVVVSTWADRADLAPALATTTVEAVVGLALAVAVAVPLAISIDWSRTARAGVYPLVVASQTVPVIALAPLVVIWFGFGEGPKIGLVALFSFFPIVVGAVQGLASADRDAVDLLRTMRASRWQLLWRVRWPSALPQCFTGLKISVTYAYTSAIVAEYVGATQGLGVYMNAASQAAPRRTDLVFGATGATALATVALFLLVGLAERLAMPWRPPSRS
jgi:ABC-type nitrate/sulfonate/bicarbonate transport system permease component